MKGGKNMTNLIQTELYDLKKIIKENEILYQKFNDYATKSTDEQVKQLFTKGAQDALNAKQKLMSFLKD